MKLDPDPHSQYGSGSRTAKWMRIHAAPDPQHCLGGSLTWVTTLTTYKKQAYFGGGSQWEEALLWWRCRSPQGLEAAWPWRVWRCRKDLSPRPLPSLPLQRRHQHEVSNDHCWVFTINQKRSYTDTELRYVSVSGRLCVDPDRDHSFRQCCGSGSVSFWASQIRIQIHPGPDLNPDPSIIKQKK